MVTKEEARGTHRFHNVSFYSAIVIFLFVQLLSHVRCSKERGLLGTRMVRL